VTAAVPCNAQSKHRPQPWEPSAGGVSERAGAKAGGSNLSATYSFASRDGERHPGFLEGGALRGASSERRPRSVRRWSGFLSLQRCAGDSGCPEDAEEGNVVAHTRFKAYAPAQAREIVARAPADASFARSFDPCVSILTMHEAPKASSWWGGRSGITVGQTHESGRNQHWGWTVRTQRGSPRVTASAREKAWHVEKRKEVEASVPARKRGSRLVARTSCFCCRSLQATSGLE
jgi:hypothetical protein